MVSVFQAEQGPVQDKKGPAVPLCMISRYTDEIVSGFSLSLYRDYLSEQRGLLLQQLPDFLSVSLCTFLLFNLFPHFSTGQKTLLIQLVH